MFSSVITREITALTGRVFDLIVVGGGFFGAAAAWEAASRGLVVALIEKNDFISASSANHLKMAHGGIRYTQHADIPRIRESCHERSTLLRIAPHLVEPLPIIIPTYGHGMKGKEILRAGMAFYDLVTCDRNRGIQCPDRKVPRGSFLNTEEVAAVIPGIEQKGLTGAAVFYDGQMYNPPRLGVSFIRSASSAGATALNYCELKKIEIHSGRVCGVEVLDSLTGETVSVQCKSVLLTAGGWTHRLLKEATGIELQPEPAFSRDLAFIIDRPLIKQYGFACPLKTKDADAVLDRGGRHLFVAPWRDRTLVGVWHGIFKQSPDQVSTTTEELSSYLAEVNAAHPGFSLKLDDISMVLTGLTLFGAEEHQDKGEMSFGKRSLLTDHKVQNGVNGLVSLIGVRATMARGMAEKAVNMLATHIDHPIKPSATSTTPVFGGNLESVESLLTEVRTAYREELPEDVIYALVRNYGSEYKRVLQYGQENPLLLMPIGSSTVIGAEIIHAIREEMAIKLMDIIFRRTDLGTTGTISHAEITACGSLMAKELNWEDDHLQQQIEEVQNHVDRRAFLVTESPLKS